MPLSDQAMVFVHSRKDTGRTARSLMEEAQRRGEYDLFACADEGAMEASLLLREVRGRFLRTRLRSLCRWASSCRCTSACAKRP